MTYLSYRGVTSNILIVNFITYEPFRHDSITQPPVQKLSQTKISALSKLGIKKKILKFCKRGILFKELSLMRTYYR